MGENGKHAPVRLVGLTWIGGIRQKKPPLFQKLRNRREVLFWTYISRYLGPKYRRFLPKISRLRRKKHDFRSFQTPKNPRAFGARQNFYFLLLKSQNNVFIFQVWRSPSQNCGNQGGRGYEVFLTISTDSLYFSIKYNYIIYRRSQEKYTPSAVSAPGGEKSDMC